MTEETGKQGKTKLANIANSEGTDSYFVASELFIWCKDKTECDNRQKLPNSLFINKFIFMYQLNYWYGNWFGDNNSFYLRFYPKL